MPRRRVKSYFGDDGGGLVAVFLCLARVGFAVGVCDGRSKPLPYVEDVCLNYMGEVCGYRQDGGSKPPPYHNLFVSAVGVRYISAFPSGEGGPL